MRRECAANRPPGVSAYAGIPGSAAIVTAGGRARRRAPFLALCRSGSLARFRPMLVRRCCAQRMAAPTDQAAPLDQAALTDEINPANPRSVPAKRPPDAQHLGDAPGLGGAATGLERRLWLHDLRDGSQSALPKVILERSEQVKSGRLPVN